MSAQRSTPSAHKYKQRMKWKVTSLLGFLVILFAILYVPPDMFRFVSDSLSTAGSLALRVGFSVPLVFFAQWIIFAQDHLANGDSKASRFFRECYASKYATEHYGIPADRARTLWFDYFNSWSQEDHPLHGYYRSSFERSYSLRLIFYLKRVLWFFFAIAMGFTGVATWRADWTSDAGMLGARLGVALLAGVVALSLTVSNRAIPNADEAGDQRWHATGAYAKYQEIAGILRVKFQDEVLEPQFGEDAKGQHTRKEGAERDE
jgi:hypothetical protein